KVPVSCESWALEEKLIETRGDLKAFRTEVEAFFDLCKKHWDDNEESALFQILRSSKVVYDFEKNRWSGRLELVDIDGFKTQAVLALQPTHDFRPLVLVKCGLQCNIGDPSTRHFFSHVFDEAPFHILMIPSTTSDL